MIMFRTLSFVLSLLLLASIAINVLQGKRIMALQTEVQNGESRGALMEGTAAPVFTLRDLVGGREKRIEYSGTKPTVLYIFRPSCIWCQRNSAAVNFLAERAVMKYTFIGVSLTADNVADFVKDHHIDFPVYTMASPSQVERYGLGTTPETIVVSEVGTVLKDWSGAYSGATKRQLEDYFSIQLPGLAYTE